MAQVTVLTALWKPSDLDALFATPGPGGTGSRYTEVTGAAFVVASPLLAPLADGTDTIAARVEGRDLIYTAEGVPRGGTIERVTILDREGTAAILIEDAGFQIIEPLSGGTIESGLLARDDFIVATGSSDRIDAVGGDDLVLGGGGADFIDGGDGNDTLFGGNGGDRLIGDGSRDVGDDILHGEAGNDALYGGDGDDQLYGGDGDDLLDGGAGNNFLEGGDGDDRFSTMPRSGESVAIGGAGDDTLSLAPDRALMDAGATTFVGGAGVDELNAGGLGLIADQRTFQVFLNGGWAGFDDGETIAYLSDVENVRGSVTSSNLLIGDAADNVLFGGDRADYINGGDGGDVIVAGGGDDVMEGGAGRDAFVFTGQFLNSQNGDDLILDFEVGADVLDFSQTRFVTGVTDLEIANDGFGSLVSYLGSSIYVANIGGADLTADDFVF